jgi:hypothetical protein
MLFIPGIVIYTMAVWTPYNQGGKIEEEEEAKNSEELDQKPRRRPR